MAKQSSIANNGITIETLTMIRSRFIPDWYVAYATRVPIQTFRFSKTVAGGWHV